jgi:hypothetical protein
MESICTACILHDGLALGLSVCTATTVFTVRGGIGIGNGIGTCVSDMSMTLDSGCATLLPPTKLDNAVRGSSRLKQA